MDHADEQSMELEALEAILGEDGLLSTCPSKPAAFGSQPNEEVASKDSNLLGGNPWYTNPPGHKSMLAFSTFEAIYCPVVACILTEVSRPAYNNPLASPYQVSCTGVSLCLSFRHLLHSPPRGSIV